MRKSTFGLALSLLVTIAWLGLQGNQPRAADAAKPAVQKWEYYIIEKVFLNSKDKSDFAKQGLDTLGFDKLGNDGWEICGTPVFGESTQSFTAVFKRPKK